MMNNVNVSQQFRKFAMELESVSDENESLIRTAGVLKRFQTWLRKLTDSSFREELGGAWFAINGLQNELKGLDQEFEKLKDKVKNGDLEGYSAQLQDIRKQTLKMLDSLRDAQQGQKKVQKILWNYTKDEMKEEGFDERIRSYLPSDFDLEFGKVYRKPLKDFVWYSALTSDMIFVNAKGETGKSAGESLVERIINALVQAGIGNKEEMKVALELPEVRSRLFENFREAVVNGELITVEPAEPSARVKRTLVGQTTAHVTTAPFAVPEIGVTVQAQVGLIDLRTSLASRKKLSLKYTKNVTVVGKIASRIDQLRKLAEQVSLQYTQLSEIELANVLREGYRKAFGSDPTMEALAGGWAQVILEAGRPIRLPRNNIGNLKAGNDWVQAGMPYFVKDTQEFDKAGKSFTHSGAKWKAFETPVDGAVEYWKYLGRKHPAAMQWMAAGDPNSATVALAKNTYFTANIKQYASGVSKLYAEFVQKIAPKLPGLKSEPKAPPGQKPELKDWISEYSKEELESMNKPTPTTNMSGKEQKIEQESDQLMQTLMASKNGILTFLVKEAVLKTTLPEQKVLITFADTDKSSPKYALAECARVSADVLKNVLGGKVSVIETPNGEHFGVYASILGNSETVFDAVTAVCDSVKEAIGTNEITPIISLGFELQEMKRISEEDLKGFHRQAKLKGIEND